MSGKTKLIVLTVIIYGILLAGVLGITALLTEELTLRLGLSLLFVLLPLTTVFGLVCYMISDSHENVMQNNAMIMVAVLYFAAALVATLVINLIALSMNAFLVVELIVSLCGVIAILWAYRGKQHIENC